MTPLLVPVFAFTAAAIVLTLTPGLDTAMVLRSSAAEGRRGGAAAAAGISLGLLIWGAGAAFGLTALLGASRLAFSLVKWAGAAYLAFLGLKLLLKPREAWSEGTADASVSRSDACRGGEWPQAFRRALLSNLLNPKVGVFYITFLPQFIPHGYNVAAVSMLLTGIHVLLGLAWSLVLIALTVPLGRFLKRGPVVKALDRITGVVFLGFGLRLALTEA